ncbi:hypothetical protein DFP72DRAFT_814901 [Ephemerocybe angulata]|uniref:Uncharacterized protein n=1 Tax=Ephemerocybe angulata TaxID=980116 RepID=A0A8H6HV33_9AGAR|nr:hypothetical protein DFP72DRAFT_814901 [Tulosesus angulatus]
MDCPGISAEWTAGPILSTYPFALHVFRDIGWQPLRFDAALNTITLRSDNCARKPNGKENEPCQVCLVMKSSDSLRRAMERAKNLLEDFSRTMRQLRSQVHNLKQQLAGSQKKIDDYERIVMLLSKGDIPGLRRILAASLKRGASAPVILNLLERALKGLHRARGGFSARDLDVAFLAKAIGGPRLLYALQKAFGLPSATTLRKEQKIPALVPSIGRPSADEINANISAFCAPEVKPVRTPSASGSLTGNTLMFDGVTLETRCSYCSRRDRVLGLCREHGHRVDTRVTDIAAIETIRKALFDPDSDEQKVCFGTEATVVAIAPYSPENYLAVPLVASPSCKTEKGEQIRLWIKDVIALWKSHPCGERMHGPIWALASDGDAAYRLAKYLECLEGGVEVDVTQGYGQFLKDLEGLNLLTSPDGVLGTCDPKHIFKRFATLLRNTTGFMVGETNIKANDVLEHLTRLDGISQEVAQELLNPADKQNVPKAVTLLQHLGRLDETPYEDLSPAQQHRRNTLIFLGKFFELFLKPFITVDMSLSDQVESLVAFAHVATALYLEHQTASLTGALYADTQAVIKNIIFTIARMQDMDPDLVLHILQEGTDRLEVLFGDTRTQDHSPNYDIKQFSEKAAVGALINAAFARNPDMNRGHPRLSISGTLGIDHVNPKSWKAPVRVGDVNLKACWDAGIKRALDLIKRYLPSSFPTPNFQHLWSQKNCDLLRPKGTYVGTRNTEDDLRSESDETPVPTSSVGQAPAPDAPSFDQPSAPESSVLQEVRESGIEDAGSAAPDRISFAEMQAMDGGLAGDGDDDIPIGIDLEDCFPDAIEDSTEDSGAPSTTAEANSKRTLDVNGKQLFKSSIIAAMLSSKWAKKTSDRLLRVRGMAKGEWMKKSEDDLDDSNLTENQVKVGDLAGLLLNAAGSSDNSPKSTALSVIEITGFVVSGERAPRTSIEFDELNSSKTKVIGQVIDLAFDSTHNAWDWTGHYLRIGPGTKAAPDLSTRKQYVLEVNGALVFPLSPKTVKRSVDASQALSSLSYATWRLSHTSLLEASKSAWTSLNPETEEIVTNINLLHPISNQARFPYLKESGQPQFVIEDIPKQLREITPVKRANSKVACFLCLKEGIPVGKMMEHPGASPCGFCGRDECFTQLKKTSPKVLTISSTCPYRRSKMPPSNRYDKFDPEHPCSNTPLYCTLCPKTASNDPRTVWRYNAAFHLAIEHSGQEIPPTLLVNMFITKKEEEAMGIQGDATDDFRGEYNVPDSDGLDAMLLDPGEGETGARGRSHTITSSNRRR